MRISKHPDIDLKGFFDEVDHCLLRQILYHKIKCRETMRLIRQWLRIPILLDGKLVKRRKCVPQGSPLSPLLSISCYMSWTWKWNSASLVLSAMPTISVSTAYQLVVEEKRWKTLKTKLREITRKTKPMSFDQRMQKLKEVHRDWINYFKFTSIYNKLNELDGWLCNRIRYCIWIPRLQRFSRQYSF